MVEMYDEGRAVFAAARAHLAGDQDAARVVGTALYEGRPTEVLCAASARSPLCVVGRRGRGRAASRILGSTSSAAAAETAIPLVVVPPEWEPDRNDGRYVLVGVDIPPRDTGPLDFAFEAARQASAALVVLCSWDLGADAPVGPEVGGALGDVLGEILAPWRARFPEVDMTVDIEHAHPARALVARAEHARVVVLGTRTHRPRPGFSATASALRGGGRSHGAVARAVLRDAAVPVAVVPAPVARASEPLGAAVGAQAPDPRRAGHAGRGRPLGWRARARSAHMAGYFARTSLSRSMNANESS
jgi:nucleotide-binding universal stress UspA family protein